MAKRNKFSYNFFQFHPIKGVTNIWFNFKKYIFGYEPLSSLLEELVSKSLN